MRTNADNSSQKINALIHILSRLDAGSRITAPALAASLGVSERTVYRYMMTLQQAGYPIYFDRDQMSYRFVEGFTLNRSSDNPELFTALDLKSRMLRSSPIGLLSYDDTGQCVEANEAAVAIVGGSREQVLAQNYLELASWRRSGLLLMAQDVMRNGTEQSGDFPHVTTFGRDTWLHCHMSCFMRDGRKHLLLIVEDIRDRKLAEQALLESEEVLRLFVENSPAYTFIKDENSRFVQASSNYEQLLGRPMAEIIGRDMAELFPTAFADQILQDDRIVWNSWRKLEIEEEFDGRYFVTVKFPFERGGKRYLAGYAIDITERKHVELQLAEYAARFRTLTESTLDAFWIVDGSGTIREVNDRACEMYGYRREEMIGMHLQMIEADESPEELLRHMQLILERGYDRFVTRQRRRDGSFITAEVNTARIPDSTNVLTFIREISGA